MDTLNLSGFINLEKAEQPKEGETKQYKDGLYKFLGGHWKKQLGGGEPEKIEEKKEENPDDLLDKLAKEKGFFTEKAIEDLESKMLKKFGEINNLQTQVQDYKKYGYFYNSGNYNREIREKYSKWYHSPEGKKYRIDLINRQIKKDNGEKWKLRKSELGKYGY